MLSAYIYTDHSISDKIQFFLDKNIIMQIIIIHFAKQIIKFYRLAI